MKYYFAVGKPITVVELSTFVRAAAKCFTAAERAELGQLARRLVATYGGRLDDV